MQQQPPAQDNNNNNSITMTPTNETSSTTEAHTGPTNDGIQRLNNTNDDSDLDHIEMQNRT